MSDDSAYEDVPGDDVPEYEEREGDRLVYLIDEDHRDIEVLFPDEEPNP